jgi:hypothetical protein
MAATRALPVAALIVLCQCVIPPSHKPHPTEWDILRARQKAVWFQADYRRVGPVITPGPPAHAEYHPGGKWDDTAKASPAVRE